MSDRLAAVLDFCEMSGLDADEVPWVDASIAVHFQTLDVDERLQWDVDALVVASTRFRPVAVDFLHRFIVCRKVE